MKHDELGIAVDIQRFATREESLARQSNSALPYLRQEDSLCQGFLKLATCPIEHNGLSLLFPFVREMALLGLNRTINMLPTWMHLAFMAGHELGVAHPDGLDEVLPGLELREAMRRLGVLRHYSGEEHLTFSGLRDACVRIVQAQWRDVTESQLEPVLLGAVVKTLRTGFVAATFTRTDPVHCEFVCDIPDRISDCISDILSRSLVGAARNALGKTIPELLEHPLLRLAREYYPGKEVELQMALHFFRERLWTLGVKSENECPASELDLADWVAAGMNYGHRLQEHYPDMVAAIFGGCNPNDLEGTLQTVRELAAKGTEPCRLVQNLKDWQQAVFGWREPKCYGDELARVVYCADFAMWIAWVSCKVPTQ